MADRQYQSRPWSVTCERRLCDSVSASLQGQRLGSFTRVSSAVKVALEAALTRILTPKRSIDVLREVRLIVLWM